MFKYYDDRQLGDLPGDFVFPGGFGGFGIFARMANFHTRQTAAATTGGMYQSYI